MAEGESGYRRKELVECEVVAKICQTRQGAR